MYDPSVQPSGQRQAWVRSTLEALPAVSDDEVWPQYSIQKGSGEEGTRPPEACVDFTVGSEGRKLHKFNTRG